MASTATATATSGGDAAAATMLATVDDWDSDVAMSHMFAAFRSARGADPDDWDARMAFWRRAIDIVRARGVQPERRRLWRGSRRRAASRSLRHTAQPSAADASPRGSPVLHAMREQATCSRSAPSPRGISCWRARTALVASPMSALRRAMGWGSKGAGSDGDGVIVPLVGSDRGHRMAPARARGGNLPATTTEQTYARRGTSSATPAGCPGCQAGRTRADQPERDAGGTGQVIVNRRSAIDRGCSLETDMARCAANGGPLGADVGLWRRGRHRGSDHRRASERGLPTTAGHGARR